VILQTSVALAAAAPSCCRAGFLVRTENVLATELEVFCGRTIDVASLFIAGKSDWGTYQFPGTFERMQRSACTRMLGCHLVDGAGHWVQQERPEQVTALLLEFLQQCPR
jgi:pimeloyl-ACP methyl ester carboxylesterase